MKQKSLFLLQVALLGSLGVQIYNCKNNTVDIFEDNLVPVKCVGIDNTGDVEWQRGDSVRIGECLADGTCTSSLNDYTLSRSPSSSESQLKLQPEYRRHAGVTVSCHDTGGASTASCTLVIRRHAVLSDCNVTTNTVSQTVSGSCLVQEAYSSDNIYTCSWSVNNQQSLGGFDSAREKCSFTHPLPTEGGLYTYTIAVFPPSTAGFSQTVTIELPTSSGTWSISSLSPELTHSDNVTTSASTPDSHLDTRWIIGGVVIAVMFIAILIAATCVAVNRNRLRCRGFKEEAEEITDCDFQEHVNVVYDPSEGQGQQPADTEDHYYSSADVE